MDLGVFDGHGKKGHFVSDFVAAILPRLLLQKIQGGQNIKEALSDTFVETMKLIETATTSTRMDAWDAGSTGTVVVHDRALHKITVAHVGDSRACLGREGRPRSCLQKLCGCGPKPFLALTKDHKPEQIEEKKRIENSGGTVVFDGYFNYRVYATGKDYPGMNMSRAFGDMKGHRDAGITAQPTVMELDLDAGDKYLLLCSDGVWEFMTPKDVVEWVAQRDTLPASEAAQQLAREAHDRWITEEEDTADDITAILVRLDTPALVGLSPARPV